MTHTLHRRTGPDRMEEDFVILAMPARGINNDGETMDKLRRFLTIFSRHHPVNLGGIGTGNLYDSEPAAIIRRVYPDLPMVQGVFRTRADLVAALKEIKTEDLGISVIVSGLVDAVDCCAREAGLSRHSINYSLGVWGRQDLLPDPRYLEITTLCGHAMISVNLVQKMLSDVRSGHKTLEQAAAELAKPCVCGIFNAARAQAVLAELI